MKSNIGDEIEDEVEEKPEDLTQKFEKIQSETITTIKELFHNEMTQFKQNLRDEEKATSVKLVRVHRILSQH